MGLYFVKLRLLLCKIGTVHYSAVNYVSVKQDELLQFKAIGQRVCVTSAEDLLVCVNSALCVDVHGLLTGQCY